MTKRKGDKRKPDSWMPLFIGDYLADTTTLSTEQHGAFLLLLMAMWRNGGKLADVDDELAAITRLPAARWKAHRAKLLSFFQVRDGWITQKRLSEEYARAWEVYDKRVASGKQGGRPPIGDLFSEPKGEPNGSPNGYPSTGTTTTTTTNALDTDDASRKNPLGDSLPARAVLLEAVQKLAAAGVETSTTDPFLLAVYREGFDLGDVLRLACSKKGRGKGIAYLVATLRGQRQDAQAQAAATLPSGDVLPHKNPLADLQREVEAECIDARHLRDVIKIITPAECDRRIAAAKARLQEQPA